MQNRKKYSGREGFTLVEVMLVLFILMSLAVIAIGALRGVQAEARKRQAKTIVGQLATAVENFEAIYDRFPSMDEGLDALRHCPASIDSSEYKPFLNTDLGNDPWGQPYTYQYPGRAGDGGFDVCSSGPDMQLGTADDIVVSR